MAEPDVDHRLDHIVVVMFENRSFDNLLGYLYRPGEVPSFEGVAGRDLSNPIPPYAPGAEAGTVHVHPAENMDTPDPDSGEEYPHTNTQLFGIVAPSENRFGSAEEMLPPFNAPGEPEPAPTMDGFVTDYVNNFRNETGRLPRPDEYAQIMACYTSEQMPVLSALAKGFACFDHWFCEVPSQTFTNRSFFHAASSSGFVLNHPEGNFVLHNEAETIFDRLEAAHVSWRVYFDPLQLVSATGLVHARRLAPYFATHFASTAEFYDEAAKGKLPAYAFIEPNMIPPHADMHPPGYSRARRLFPFLPRPAALRGGEMLLAKIYEAIRTSATPGGSNYQNTLLIVTFDEHGGTYDHVPPPRVPPPDPSAPAGQMGFRFDRSGLRVPTLAISAWIDARTVVSREFRSTSVIRTLRERWSLGGPLTQRDAVAADIAPVLSRTTPRPPEDWPRVTPHRAQRWASLFAPLERTLPALGTHLFAAAIALDAEKTGRPPPIDISRVSRSRALRHVRTLRVASFPRATQYRRS